MIGLDAQSSLAPSLYRQMHSELDTLSFAASLLLEQMDECVDRCSELEELLRLESEKLGRFRNRSSELSDWIAAALEGHSVVLQTQDDPLARLRGLRDALGEFLSSHQTSASDENVALLLRRLAQTPTPSHVSGDAPTSLELTVRQTLASLPDVDAMVLGLRFGLYGFPQVSSEAPLRAQAAIATALGCSQATVSRMIDKAIRRLRHPARSDQLRPFLAALSTSGRLTAEQRLLVAVFQGPTRSVA